MPESVDMFLAKFQQQVALLKEVTTTDPSSISTEKALMSLFTNFSKILASQIKTSPVRSEIVKGLGDLLNVKV